ncbi:hypothetical protein FACS1894176_01900 [Bacteroidia bacterium]|nr:hypothetical protein FACS1894176_01900 [Bacteroidia bacterium]
MPVIVDPDNLRLAFWKARKGKDTRPEVNEFRADLDNHLLQLRKELLSGKINAGNYTYFKVYDPKERLICAAPFRERVLHHALMNICHPRFEKFQLAESYATRPGKGQYAALEKAHKHVKQYRWFCKLDVRKFFDSINHEVLYSLLCRKFKDPVLLEIFRQIIDSYASAPGRGLPIGNLTSQYFANFYLSAADHYIKEVLQVPAYVRYMDDMVLWHSDKQLLLKAAEKLEIYIRCSLKMELKPQCVNTVDRGVPFLGYVLFPEVVRLNKNSKKRFLRKYKKYEEKLRSGSWSQQEYACHILPLMAFTRFADARNFRRKMIEKMETSQKALTACNGVGTGTTTRRTAVPPIATTTPLLTVTTT